MRLNRIESRRKRLLACGLCWLLLSASICLPLESTSAAQRAVIVGVNEYENLAQRLQLTGPGNDALRVDELLRRRGFAAEDIALLADCPDQPVLSCPDRMQAPTRTAIIGALQALVDTAAPGDFVYLHFSGHGSQQPALRPETELDDRLEEIFLPRDVGRWSGELGSVKNAIMDNEVADYVAQMRNRGAFVWAVFDTCHSGTMLRRADYPTAGATPGERERRVNPEWDLQVPATLLEKLKNEVSNWGRALADGTQFAGAQTKLASNAGDFVAFYASQPDETTPELRLPAGMTPRRMHGLFTFTLMSVLDTHPTISYRRALEQVVARYDGMRRFRPTPMYEGTALDAAVFGETEVNARPQWPVELRDGALELRAGSLHELGAGSVFMLLPEPAAPDSESLGLWAVSELSLSRSRLMPVDSTATPAPDRIPSTAYARLVRREISRSLRLASPRVLDGSKILKRVATDAIESINSTTLDLQWSRPDEPADIYPLISENSVWLLPPGGELVRLGPGRTPSIPLSSDPDRFAQQLATALGKVARASTLLGNASFAPSPDAALDVQLLVRRRGKPDFEKLSVLELRDRLYAGDRLRLELTNKWNEAVDVTALFVDAEWGIEPVIPSAAQAGNRLAPGLTIAVEATVTPVTTGVEHMVVIAVPAESASPASFAFLRQSGISSLDPVRGGSVSQSDWLPDDGTWLSSRSWRTVE